MDFNDKNVLKLLYTSLVRSKVESAAIIWGPHESSYKLILEKVQKAFLRSLYKKCYGYYPFLYPTAFLQGTLGFNSLETRRNYQLTLTVCRIVRGEYDCPELVSEALQLYVPDSYMRGRGHKLLALPSCRTVARQQSPLLRGLRFVRQLLDAYPDVDIFADRWSKLSNKCLESCENVP
ncbi:hypothetical protein NE865_13574 [Phthorimaea operculella]|nr:hypothetical protein NE865_13574 [Phthorimaea operculella]